MLEFKTLLQGPFSGEVPLWDDRRNCLFFVDMAVPAVHAVNLDGSAHRTWPMPELAASIGLGESGRLIVSQPQRLLTLDPDSGVVEELAKVPHVPDTNRLNDGRTGPDGAFWVGSMDMRPEREEIGSLYRVTGDGNVHCVLENQLKISNGLAWSPDGRTMYLSDSRGPWVDVFDFDVATGAMSNRRRLVELSEAEGRPDGAACDMRGFYWSAGVSAGRLNVFRPDGTLEAVIPTPVSAPSMASFCGPDLDLLVVTSLIPAEPRAGDGAVLIAKAPVAGVKLSRWRDQPGSA